MTSALTTNKPTAPAARDNARGAAFARIELAWRGMTHNSDERGRIDHAVSIRIESIDAEDDRVRLHAQHTMNGELRELIPAGEFTCRRDHDGDLLHLEIPASGNGTAQPLLRLTVHQDGRLLFAQSALLRETGLHPGALEPPTAVLT